MSKKLFLAVLPLLALAMASCSRGNGGASSQTSSSKGGDSSQTQSSGDESSGGDESSEDDSSDVSYEESAHTYTLNGTTVNLYVDEDFDGETDVWGGVAKFVSGPIDVEAGDTIAVTANPLEGEPVAVYANSFNANNNVSGEEPGSYTVKADAEGAILSLYQYESGWAFNLTGGSGGGGGGGEGGGEVPTTGFAIVVTGTSGKAYYTAEDNGMQYGKKEYKSLGVTVGEGDVITCYDASSLVEWAITSLNEHSVSGFSEGSTGITSSTTGTFDIYIQLAFNNDTIYIGPHSA